MATVLHQFPKWGPRYRGRPRESPAPGHVVISPTKLPTAERALCLREGASEGKARLVMARTFRAGGLPQKSWSEALTRGLLSPKPRLPALGSSEAVEQSLTELCSVPQGVTACTSSLLFLYFKMMLCDSILLLLYPRFFFWCVCVCVLVSHDIRIQLDMIIKSWDIICSDLVPGLLLSLPPSLPFPLLHSSCRYLLLF